MRRNDLGDIIGDALDIARAKSVQVKERLNTIHTASTFKRVSYIQINTHRDPLLMYFDCYILDVFIVIHLLII